MRLAKCNKEQAKDNNTELVKSINIEPKKAIIQNPEKRQ